MLTVCKQMLNVLNTSYKPLAGFEVFSNSSGTAFRIYARHSGLPDAVRGLLLFRRLAVAESKLPGRPRVSLVKEVKKTLRLYFSSRPGEWDTNWRQCWAWADEIRWKTTHFGKGSPPWPSATEIASQYVLLCLTSMRDGSGIRLHPKAVEAMPQAVSLRLTMTDDQRLRIGM